MHKKIDISRTPPAPDAAWFRALLDHYGCGQREAARLLWYDERTIRRWVAGDRQPTRCVCEALRAYFAKEVPRLGEE